MLFAGLVSNSVSSPMLVNIFASQLVFVVTVQNMQRHFKELQTSACSSLIEKKKKVSILTHQASDKPVQYICDGSVAPTNFHDVLLYGAAWLGSIIIFIIIIFPLCSHCGQ